MKIVFVVLAGVVLSGCMKTNSYYPREYGKAYDIYPYIEGTAVKTRKEGRLCWAESNRTNWDLCY